MKPRYLLIVLCLCLFSISAFGQANGKLQLHFIDVGQGDGAILISPQGETVLFDNGVSGVCDKPMQYLQSIGITKIDYMIVSHYHADHFGCTRDVLKAFPLTNFSYDRPGAYNSPQYTAYVKAVGSKRKSVNSQTTITLDAGSDHPVKIKIAGYNGAGVPNANHENDRNVAAVIHFGQFDVMMAGDLSGYRTSNYKDVETTISKRVGQMEVLKVNHHGSRFSSNEVWLAKLKPRVAMVSSGNGNSHGHPNQEALDRIHAANVEKTYWTERGQGATPKSGKDIVADGSIVVQVTPGGSDFTVSYGNESDTYPMWPTPYNGKK